MSKTAKLKSYGDLLLSVCFLSFAVYMLFAVYFQFFGAVRVIFLASVIAYLAAIFVVFIRWRRAGFLFSLVFIAVMSAWWSGVLPSNSRKWAQDVAHGVTASIHNDDVTLYNVRNFNWVSKTEFTPRWEARHYQLHTITSVDLISSTWSSPAIAHTLISFGFKDGSHVVFSAEIRKEAHEEFSEIAGFFRKYELVLIAADERDIIRLRTNIRKEDVSLYRLEMPDSVKQKLFLSFLDYANNLDKNPSFYNTLTTNCTTIIFQLGRLIDPALVMDWRILLSGYVPDYLYGNKLINTHESLATVKEQARISQKGQLAGDGINFSQKIRDLLD